MTMTNKPVKLQTSRAWRTYLGGSMISRLHGETGGDGHFPEEWLLSTVAARNAGREHIVEGITQVVATGETLAEYIASAPEAILGKAHAEKYGANPGVLVKLLDAAERLTLQVHPTREKAMALFGSAFGKTECWHILDCRTIDGQAPCIYMGFREGITREHWKACFDTQDIPAMLACLHRIPVQKGDTFIIRGGVPHGIGCGCFLVEIQEPTDYTVRTERTTPSGLQVADFMCHQGLGFGKMFDCFDYTGASLAQTLEKFRVMPVTEELPGGTVEHIIYPQVTDMFALDRITVNTEVRLRDDRFFGIYVMAGKGTLDGQPITVGSHYLIPADCDGITLTTDPGEKLQLFRFFGPQP